MIMRRRVEGCLMENMKTDRERERYIDVMRSLAMCFVFIGYLGIKSGLTQHIYAFHMPAFFFVSGLTLSPIYFGGVQNT